MAGNQAIANDPTEEDMASVYSYMGICLKDMEEYERLQKKWIDNNLNKWGINYTSRKALGGRFVGNFADRGDNRDWNQIRSWAEEVGRSITTGINEVA